MSRAIELSGKIALAVLSACAIAIVFVLSVIVYNVLYEILFKNLRAVFDR